MEYRKVSIKEWLFFLFLSLICVIGTVGIIWFAVGIEQGNHIMNGFLQSLLNNATGIVLLLIVFNIFLVLFYARK